MKFILIIVVAVATASASYAQNGGEGSLAHRFSVDVGGGFNSDYGLIGASFRYFPLENLDLHYSTGLDWDILSGIGARFYFSTYSQTCFFYFPCTEKLYLGATAMTSSGGSITLSDSGGTATFSQTTGSATSLEIGVYDLLSAHFTVGFEFGYRVWQSRPTFVLISGPNTPGLAGAVNSLGQDTFIIALTLGWVF